MDYYFCGDCYSADADVDKDPVYEPFYFGSADCICQTEVVYTDYAEELQNPVFRNVQGLSVYLNGKTETRVYRNFFTGSVDTIFTDDGDRRILQILSDKNRPSTSITELNLLNSLALEKQMSERGKFILHSSFIETPQGAVLFTAPSGTGKSTQADLWNRYRRTEIINGDRSGIWKDGNTWMAGGVPWCGTSGIMKNRSMPLRAVVILKQGPDNEILSARFLYKTARILEQITVNPWNQQMLHAARDFSAALCQEIPVLILSCRPDAGAVEVLERELEKLI